MILAVSGTVVVYVFFPNLLTVFLIKLARKVFKLKSKTVNVDGYTWHYLDSCHSGRDTIVLVHGFAANKDNWLVYSRYLGKKFRVIAVDLPGFGDNQKDPNISYQASEQAQRLHRFIEVAQLGRVHLVGNSMGGMISINYGLMYPDAPKSLMLMNCVGIASSKPSMLEKAVSDGTNPLLVESLSELDEMMALVTHKPVHIPIFIKRYLFTDMVINREFYDGIFWSLLTAAEGQPEDLTEKLPNIIAPVMVMWGQNDQLLDVSCAHAIKKKLPSSSLVVFDNVGHVPMVEVPEKAAAEYLKFLANVKP